MQNSKLASQVWIQRTRCNNTRSHGFNFISIRNLGISSQKRYPRSAMRMIYDSEFTPVIGFSEISVHNSCFLRLLLKWYFTVHITQFTVFRSSYFNIHSSWFKVHIWNKSQLMLQSSYFKIHSSCFKVHTLNFTVHSLFIHHCTQFKQRSAYFKVYSSHIIGHLLHIIHS